MSNRFKDGQFVERARHALLALIAVAVCGGGLLVAGLMSAYSPDFTIRLTPLALLAVVLLTALLNRNPAPVNSKFLTIWVTTLLAVLALWPSYLLIKVGGLPALDLRRIAAGLSVLVGMYYLAAGRAAKTSSVSAGAGPIHVGYWIVTSYAIWRLLSCAVSPAPIASVIQVFWEALYYFSLFFIGHVFFSTDLLRVRVHKVIMWLILMVGAYACIERVLGANPMVQWAPSNEEFEATVRAMNLSRLRDGVFRTQGTFEHPLLLAEFAAFAGSFSLAAVISKKGGYSLRPLGIVALTASLIAAYLSGSRSAFVAMGAGLLVVAILRLVAPTGPASTKSAGLRKFVAIGLVTLSAVLAAPAVLLLSQGKNSGEAASTEARVTMLNIGMTAIENKPILGWGPGSGPSVAGIKTGDGLATMDNYLLSIAIESGVPGLCLFLACLLYPAWSAFKSIAAGAGERASFLGAVAGGTIAVLAMRAILWMPFNLSFVFLVAGIALAQCTMKDGTQKK